MTVSRQRLPSPRARARPVRDPGGVPEGERGGDQARLSQARQEVPPRREPRQQGCGGEVQGGDRGLRGAVRREAPEALRRVRPRRTPFRLRREARRGVPALEARGGAARRHAVRLRRLLAGARGRLRHLRLREHLRRPVRRRGRGARPRPRRRSDRRRARRGRDPGGPPRCGAGRRARHPARWQDLSREDPGGRVRRLADPARRPGRRRAHTAAGPGICS